MVGGRGAGVTASRPPEPLPPELAAFAEAIAVVQQRIQRTNAGVAELEAWSRDLRRAARNVGPDLAAGRAALAALNRLLDAADGAER